MSSSEKEEYRFLATKILPWIILSGLVLYLIYIILVNYTNIQPDILFSVLMVVWLITSALISVFVKERKYKK